MIAAVNVFNRINAATRQITGEHVARYVQTSAGADPAPVVSPAIDAS